MGYKVIIILLALCLYVCILRMLQGGQYKTKNKRVVEKTETPPCNIYIMEQDEIKYTNSMHFLEKKDGTKELHILVEGEWLVVPTYQETTMEELKSKFCNFLNTEQECLQNEFDGSLVTPKQTDVS